MVSVEALDGAAPAACVSRLIESTAGFRRYMGLRSLPLSRWAHSKEVPREGQSLGGSLLAHDSAISSEQTFTKKYPGDHTVIRYVRGYGYGYGYGYILGPSPVPPIYRLW